MVPELSHFFDGLTLSAPTPYGDPASAFELLEPVAEPMTLLETLRSNLATASALLLVAQPPQERKVDDQDLKTALGCLSNALNTTLRLTTTTGAQLRTTIQALLSDNKKQPLFAVGGYSLYFDPKQEPVKRMLYARVNSVLTMLKEIGHEFTPPSKSEPDRPAVSALRIILANLFAILDTINTLTGGHHPGSNSSNHLSPAHPKPIDDDTKTNLIELIKEAEQSLESLSRVHASVAAELPSPPFVLARDLCTLERMLSNLPIKLLHLITLTREYPVEGTPNPSRVETLDELRLKICYLVQNAAKQYFDLKRQITRLTLVDSLRSQRYSLLAYAPTKALTIKTCVALDALAKAQLPKLEFSYPPRDLDSHWTGYDKNKALSDWYSRSFGQWLRDLKASLDVVLLPLFLIEGAPFAKTVFASTTTHGRKISEFHADLKAKQDYFDGILSKTTGGLSQGVFAEFLIHMAPLSAFVDQLELIVKEYGLYSVPPTEATVSDLE